MRNVSNRENLQRPSWRGQLELAGVVANGSCFGLDVLDRVAGGRARPVLSPEGREETRHPGPPGEGDVFLFNSLGCSQ
jgi:hypothetical protein